MRSYQFFLLFVNFGIFEILHAMDFSCRPEDVLQLPSLAKVTDKDNWTILHKSAYHGNVGSIRNILESRMSDKDKSNLVNAKDKYGQTAVWWAARMGKYETLRLLLNAGGYVNASDFQHRTPLHAAAKSERREPIVVLLSRGAKVNAIDELAQTPLHYVCGAGCEGAILENERLGELAEVLLEHGANMRVKNSRGISSLAIAIRKNVYPILAACIKSGASLDEIVHTVPDPTQLALYLKRERPTLLRRNQIWNDWVNKAVTAYLVSHATKIGPNGRTALHHFSDSVEFEQSDAELNAEFIETLISAGANMSLYDKYDRSPIYLASRSRFYPILAVYIQHGASIDEATSGMRSSGMVQLARYLKHNHNDLLNRTPEWNDWVRKTLAKV